jgi:hypothetical protein
MALVVETGTASATSESFCSVADALAYFTARDNAVWLALTTAQQEVALRKATDYMEAVYSQRWAGTRTTSTQALSWPRYSVFVNGYVTSSSAVPRAIVNACSELALRAAAGELLSDSTQQKTRTKVGDIEVEFDKYSPQSAQYLAITAMLQPYFELASSVERKVVR